MLSQSSLNNMCNKSIYQRVVIVGASSGIGLEVARLFVNAGCMVGLAARRTAPLLELKKIAPERIFVKYLDVTAPAALAAATELVNQMGGMDLYVHVAGIGKQNRTLRPDIEMDTFCTNVTGFGQMIGWAYRYFTLVKKGHIAAVSSIAGTKGLGVAPAYSATKRFQNTYLQALAQQAQMEKLPIVFTDIRPGFVDTALLSGGQKYPMMMKPEKVAQSIVRAISQKKRVKVIDWRYAILTFFWRCIPDFIWERLVIRTKSK